MTWDDFEDDAKQLSNNRGGGCGVARLLQSLPEEGLNTIEAALAREDLTSAAILAAIKRRVKTDVTSYTMRRHRKGDCSCSKD